MDYWDDIKHFKPEEFDTGTETGNKVYGSGRMFMDESFMRQLDELRRLCDFPITISSGYRSHEYNEHIGATQTHATGKAADLACSHLEAFIINSYAAKCGFTGIGISQKGNNRFIHLDTLSDNVGCPRPHIWSY